tara:strand:- start:402 stop:746 length:345 start_codon:yes stop_codon:yes gene_type:complete
MPYKNKKDQAKAAAKHYRKNKEEIILRTVARNKKQIKKNKAFVDRLKRMFNCVDCGESDPLVLDFDHVKGKKRKAIADMISRSYSIETIKKEIRKCEIRCANCHRKKTHERMHS